MKSLNDYTQKPMSELLDRTGSFFAFSDKQFNEQKSDNLEPEDYRQLFGGLISPKDKAKEVLHGIAKIQMEGIEQDIAENGKEAIIERELRNHECFYTQDITDAVEALSSYDITEGEVREVYQLITKT